MTLSHILHRAVTLLMVPALILLAGLVVLWIVMYVVSGVVDEVERKMDEDFKNDEE